MTQSVYTLNAFAAGPGGGNPAGVVLDSQGFSAERMKTLAAKVGYSETAFVSPSEVADFRVRFFTPTDEVDLCGHATIATFSLLHALGRIPVGDYTQETLAGVLPVSVREDGTVLMDQSLPTYFETVDRELIAASLGLPVSALHPELPVQGVSTGLKDLFVPLVSLEMLRRIQPDMDAITALSKAHDATGYHVFTLETLHGGTAHCRNFAPLYGIPEESATGTSNGALSCYLHHYGRIPHDPVCRLTLEQGWLMGQPSEIRAVLTAEGDEIRRVQVGGIASPHQILTLEI